MAPAICQGEWEEDDRSHGTQLYGKSRIALIVKSCSKQPHNTENRSFWPL